MIVALVSDVFHDSNGAERLAATLQRAASSGAALALLPELPLNPWSPASETPRDEDAEPPDGPRHRAIAAAARSARIAALGGAIVRDPKTGARHNTALMFDHTGGLVATYRKVHLPAEEGFWETRHYEPGDGLSPIVDRLALRCGIQICSDINRPEGCHLLGALGADVILNPRATEAGTWSRWRTVLTANALTSGTYVLSVNRPRAEDGVALGGPSFAVAPTGEVLAETTDTVALVTLATDVVTQARGKYPGYLATRSDLYAEGWRQVRRTRLPHENAADALPQKR